MSYADSLRQQARWVREALDPDAADSKRITLEDVDVDELDAAADELENLRAALECVRDCTHHPVELIAIARNVLKGEPSPK